MSVQTLNSIRARSLRTGTMLYIGNRGTYSTYLEWTGRYVHLRHVTHDPLFELAELDLSHEWAIADVDESEFTDVIRNLVTEPALVSITFCEDCSEPEHDDMTWCVDDGRYICESCFDDYTQCDECGNYHCDDSMHSVSNGNASVCESCFDYYTECASCAESFRYTTTTLDEDDVCETCRDNYYSYCEHCDGYRRDDDDDHDHNRVLEYGNDCCESPATQFTIRNDGDDPLSNDTRVTVTLPAGEISDEGIGAISQSLRTASYLMEQTSAADYEDGSEEYDRLGDVAAKIRQLSYLVPNLGNKWQARDGNYTKRLGRLAYKEYGIKLPADILSAVGNIGSAHSTAVDVHLETTREFNQSAEDFGHADSCYWMRDHHSSRCALKTNGGFGMRAFSDDGAYDDVVGRAWVMPLRMTVLGALRPTFETESPDAYVVFNGYGTLDGYVPARLMAHMAGMTYRKIGFSCSPMWINSGAGYLIAPEDIATNYTDGNLSLSVDQHSSLFADERVSA